MVSFSTVLLLVLDTEECLTYNIQFTRIASRWQPWVDWTTFSKESTSQISIKSSHKKLIGLQEFQYRRKNFDIDKINLNAYTKNIDRK